MDIIIRKAEASDAEQVWQLMKELADFEEYADSFAITPEIVVESGFGASPLFYCMVAESPAQQCIAGIAVYYFIPYTARNRKALYLKELFVAGPFRGAQTGRKLMAALVQEARTHDCYQIKWTVAAWNKKGMEFYEKLGAEQNTQWLNYELNEERFDAVSQTPAP